MWCFFKFNTLMTFCIITFTANYLPILRTLTHLRVYTWVNIKNSSGFLKQNFSKFLLKSVVNLPSLPSFSSSYYSNSFLCFLSPQLFKPLLQVPFPSLTFLSFFHSISLQWYLYIFLPRLLPSLYFSIFSFHTPHFTYLSSLSFSSLPLFSLNISYPPFSISLFLTLPPFPFLFFFIQPFSFPSLYTPNFSSLSASLPSFPLYFPPIPSLSLSPSIPSFNSHYEDAKQNVLGRHARLPNSGLRVQKPSHPQVQKTKGELT